MTGFLDGAVIESSSGIDTGDIPASLRFRRGATPYAVRQNGGADGNRKSWALSFWLKPSRIETAAAATDGMHLFMVGNTNPNGGGGATVYSRLILGTANNALIWNSAGSSGEAFQTSNLLRDVTGHIHVLVVANHASTSIKCYINGVEASYASRTNPTNTDGAVNRASYYNALGIFHTGEPRSPDGYMSRVCFVAGGGSLTPSDFAYLNTTINEWVSKSQSEVKAVVDAGGTNSFMLDFDDATSLTTLGNDFSSKNNDWLLNGSFSLSPGANYDHMLDVPGNSFATLNPIYPSAASITNGNLTSATTAARATQNALLYDCKWEVTAGASAVTAGVISATGATNTTSVTANKCFAFRLTTAGALDYKNVTDAGSWTSITTGLTGEQYPYGITQAANWNFGQAPLHASATYQSAAGGYFYDTTAGYKALCQANLEEPAILNPKNGFVAVTATETNIDSTLTAARSWTDYVDIKKNRSNAEAWQWQFSHDSTNEYAVAASSLTRRAKSTNSGADTWVGYSIRIGAAYGTASGYVSHTNGVATTITHNIGVSARQLILLFNRAGGAAVPMYHPDATSGELLDLCTTAADAVSTAITSVGTNSFQIGSATATGTYDYLVCSEISGFFDLGKWTGNASADGAYYDAGHKPVAQWTKAISTTDDHRCYDNLRAGYNVQGGTLLLNTSGAETTTAEMDLTSRGSKARIATTPNAAQTYVTCNWAAVSGKYSLAR